MIPPEDRSSKKNNFVTVVKGSVFDSFRFESSDMAGTVAASFKILRKTHVPGVKRR